jgi:hypothetical protein
MPPADPGTMTPQQKADLGSRLGLTTPPPPMEGAGTVSGDLSDVNVAEVDSANAAAQSQAGAYDREAREVILESPAGSTATEGYHLQEQSASISGDGGVLDVGPVPPRPPQEHTDSPD